MAILRSSRAVTAVAALLAMSAGASCGSRSSLDVAASAPPPVGGPDAGPEAGPPMGTSVITLATGQTYAVSLALDATRVYWTTKAAGTVATCDKSGGAVTQLAGGQENPSSIAVSAGNVYWVQEATVAVMRCGTGGCNGMPATIGTSPDPGIASGGNLAANGSTVFWSTGSGVVQCPTASCGGAAQPIVAMNAGPTIAVDEQAVYWVDNAIVRCPVTGCPGGPTQVVPAEVAGAFPVYGTPVVAAGNLYFTVKTGTVAIATCPTTGCAEPRTIIDGLSAPAGLASDEENVYWSYAPTAQDILTTGAVMKCAVTGCPEGPATVADGQDIPGQIVLDDTSVYWVTEGGDSIMKATPK
jgi:hypothetical protein